MNDYILYFKINNNVFPAKATNGLSFLEIAQSNGIDVNGACGGNGSCGTCHIILPQEWIAKLQPSDDESDILDVVFGVEAGSRLSCQIFFSPEMNNMEVTVPNCS